MTPKETWRYRQQGGPMKAHRWLSRDKTLCGRSGKQVSGNYEPRVSEHCIQCLRALARGEEV